MTEMSNPDSSIAFQGEPGAYSHLACRNAYPGMQPLPCPTFEDTFAAVREGRARYAMIPIDNSVAGRVADVHHLMPYAGLHIIAEHFERISHHLLAVPGASLQTIKTVKSHVHALGQCRNLIRELGLRVIVGTDTAGAAAELAQRQDKTMAAIASELAAEAYGLVSLKAGIEDAEHNTTRFVVLAREALEPNRGEFSATQFYADVEGHPTQRGLRQALEELDFFSHEVRILGVYPRHPFRMKQQAGGE
ncbi:MAG: prephenate dehydratase [Magnetospirillum sp.]|nr:prephenate dehydratase [Magnetospirillum sp.]